MRTTFNSIKRGLLEAIEHAQGRAPQTRLHRPRPVDVSMTQEQFAARFGFSTATLRHWERGDRVPHGPALVLLNVIAHNPHERPEDDKNLKMDPARTYSASIRRTYRLAHRRVDDITKTFGQPSPVGFRKTLDL